MLLQRNLMEDVLVAVSGLVAVASPSQFSETLSDSTLVVHTTAMVATLNLHTAMALAAAQM